MFDFRRTTVFYLESRLSKHSMTRYPKYFWGHGPLGPPGCVNEYNVIPYG